MPAARAMMTRLLAICSHQPTRLLNKKSSTTSDSGRRQRRVQRVTGVGAEPTLEGPDLVEPVRGAGRDLLRQPTDPVGLVAPSLPDRYDWVICGGVAAPAARERGLRHRDAATRDRVHGALAETRVGAVQPAVDVGTRHSQRSVGLADDLLVGLDDAGARRGEDHIENVVST